MGKFLIVFILQVSIHLVALSQQPNKDSIYQVLPSAKEDTNKVNMLYAMEKWHMDRVNLDSAKYYGKMNEALVLKNNYTQFKHRTFHEFVRIYHALGNYDSALYYCLKGIEVAKETGNRFHEATSYRAIFNIYHNLNMNDSAVKYSAHSIKLTEEIGDTANITTNYGNLCWLYLDMSQYDKAIAYGKKGVSMGERYKDTAGLLVALNNLALCYHRTGDDVNAIPLWEYQFALAQKTKKLRSERRALINLATAYYGLGMRPQLDKSAAELNARNDNDPNLDNKNAVYQDIVNAYSLIFQKNFAKAEEHLLHGLKLAREDSIMDALLTVYETLATVKYASHQFVEGIQYAAEAEHIQLTDQEEALSEYSLELEKKYETEKKDTQLKLQDSQLQRKTFLTFLLASGAVALLIISLLSYRNYKHKQKLQQQRINELEIEKQLTAAEAVLKGEEQERTRLAKDLHDGLGGMLSGIKYSLNSMKGNLIMTPDNAQAFERSIDMLDSSIKEMRRVAHNMMPETLVKFGLDTALKDFCNDINQSGSLQLTYQSIGMENATIPSSTAIAIYRIVQELVNNAVKHAGARTLLVQVTKTGPAIALTVEDDGNGFDPAMLKAAKGMGWSNVRSRVEYLKGSLDVRSEPGKGTSVLIEFATT